MKIKSFPIFLFVSILMAGISHSQNKLSDLKGPYLGQNPPGKKAVLFALGYRMTENISFSTPWIVPKAISIGSLQRLLKN